MIWAGGILSVLALAVITILFLPSLVFNAGIWWTLGTDAAAQQIEARRKKESIDAGRPA